MGLSSPAPVGCSSPISSCLGSAGAVNNGFLILRCLGGGDGKSIFGSIWASYAPVIRECSHLYLMSLSWKPVDSESVQVVDALVSGFAELLHGKRYRGLSGLLGTVECRRSSDGLFYHHLHVLVTGGFLPGRFIQSDWVDLGGFYNVSFRHVFTSQDRALRYILKYSGDYRLDGHVRCLCPVCGGSGCWNLIEFMDLVRLLPGGSYRRSSRGLVFNGPGLEAF